MHISTFERRNFAVLGHENPITGKFQSVPYVPPPALTLLKEETFETGTLASKTGWIDLPSGNENYAAIVEIGGKKYLRHNLNGNLAATPDPISGKLRNGQYSNTFLSSDFYESTEDAAITFEMEFFLDDCWVKNKAVSPDPYPAIAGKLFLSDETVDHEACYFGLTDLGSLVLVSGNDGSAGSIWNNSDPASWHLRPEGWRTSGGAASKFIYFDSSVATLFASDGIQRKFTFEIVYNPGGIGYHKGRFKVDGAILHDGSASNTDAQGWFNLPIEYKLKGPRIYVANLDINTPLDFTTNPETYSGYALGFNVDRYAIYSGVEE